MIYTNDYESPLGNILLAGDEQGLTGLWFTEGINGPLVYGRRQIYWTRSEKRGQPMRNGLF